VRYPFDITESIVARTAPFFLAIAIASMAAASPRSLQLDDLPRPLTAGNDRSENDQDRLTALAHFAAGRTLQQRGDYARACRHFARADRLDPTSRAARSALVACAIDHKQYTLAARYAAKGIDPEEAGEEAMEVLSDYWMKTGNVTGAIESSEQLLRLISADKDAAAEHSDSDSLAKAQAGELNVRYVLRELYGMAGKQAQAAEQAARVVEVLDHPDRLHIKPESVATLLDVESRAAYRALGEAFLQAGRFAEAEAAFRKSNALAPDETLLDLQLARIAIRRGRAQEALAKLQPYFDRHRSSEGAVPYDVLADALKKLGKQAEFLARLQKLYEADLANVPLNYFLAAENLKAGKLDLAEPIYVALLGHNPTPTTFQALAEIYRKRRQPDRLLDLLGKVTAATGSLDTLGPEAKLLTSDAALFRGLVEAGRKKSAAPAKADYAALLALGFLAQEHKQYDTASEFFEAALKADVSKSSEVLLSWGIGSLLDDRASEAAEIFRRGIAIKTAQGGSGVFHFYLAGALAAAANPDAVALDAALASARTAAKLSPDSIRFAARVPWILFRARRYDEARDAYEKLLDKFGGDSDAESLETSLALRSARLELSGVCVALGRLDEADERLEEVLDDFPDDVEANNDLGFLWADRNMHLARALKMIIVSVAAEPDNRAYRDSLGWVYYRLGRFGDAVKELEKAVDEKQPDGTVLDHLGDAYEKVGNVGKAKAAWHRAVAAFEKDKEAEKAGNEQKKIASFNKNPKYQTRNPKQN
jgi:tetratricopeptide (TPR) repeat protein